MEDTYRTLEKPAEGLFRDRNSRFLSFGYPVTQADEIHQLVNGLKKKYHDARHHCYAYRLGAVNPDFRANDDGEPSGTAGKPILGQLVAYDVTNTLVVVVRYFGGTLLGTGGLINAYRSATRQMFENASIVTRFIEQNFSITFPYEKLNTVMHVMKEENLVPLHPLYEAQCRMEVAVRKSLAARFMQRFAGMPEIMVDSLQIDD
ncbi:MAG: YigZ family protein [Bacteroidales bacterium]|nr:YigZ family protein [Bacteroidales bacterium]